MATVPTPEETAREILSIFVDYFKGRAGHVLSQMNFEAVWDSRGLHRDDFEAGMNFAIEKGWVEVADEEKYSYRLTDAGFDEA